MALTQADPGLVRLARLHGRAWEEWNVELQREANRLTAAWIDALARARDPGRLRAVDHWFRV